MILIGVNQLNQDESISSIYLEVSAIVSIQEQEFGLSGCIICNEDIGIVAHKNPNEEYNYLPDDKDNVPDNYIKSTWGEQYSQVNWHEYKNKENQTGTLIKLSTGDVILALIKLSDLMKSLNDIAKQTNNRLLVP